MLVDEADEADDDGNWPLNDASPDADKLGKAVSESVNRPMCLSPGESLFVQTTRRRTTSSELSEEGFTVAISIGCSVSWLWLVVERFCGKKWENQIIIHGD